MTWVNRAINDIKLRDFEWFAPWNTASVKGALLPAVHSDIGTYFNLWSWVDAMGLYSDNLLEGRTVLLRAIWSAKVINTSQYTFTPTPTVIRDTTVLTLNGLT